MPQRCDEEEAAPPVSMCRAGLTPPSKKSGGTGWTSGTVQVGQRFALVPLPKTKWDKWDNTRGAVGIVPLVPIHLNKWDRPKMHSGLQRPTCPTRPTKNIDGRGQNRADELSCWAAGRSTNSLSSSPRADRTIR